MYFCRSIIQTFSIVDEKKNLVFHFPFTFGFIENIVHKKTIVINNLLGFIHKMLITMVKVLLLIE